MVRSRVDLRSASDLINTPIYRGVPMPESLFNCFNSFPGIAARRRSLITEPEVAPMKAPAPTRKPITALLP